MTAKSWVREGLGDRAGRAGLEGREVGLTIRREGSQGSRSALQALDVSTKMVAGIVAEAGGRAVVANRKVVTVVSCLGHKGLQRPAAGGKDLGVKTKGVETLSCDYRKAPSKI